MGQNIDLVAQEDRFFATTSGSQKLRADPENDAYLEHHFNEATRVSKTDADLAEKLIYLLSYYKLQIPYNKQNKIDAFNSNVQPVEGGSQKVRNLGTMMHAKAATCWEKAAMFHFSLAEIGIASMLEAGYKKTTGTGHAWVVLDVVGSKIVIDPTSKRIAKHSDYEEAYDITVVAKQVASPKVTVTGAKLKEALAEVHRYLGKSLETFTVQRIDLKVEQQKKKEARDAESREFDKIISQFNKSLAGK